MATYRSEVHIPVQKDPLNFQDRQIEQWDGVPELQAGARKPSWQDDFNKLRQEFYVLKPAEKQTPHPTHFVNLDPMKSVFETDSQGRQIFRVRFDVSEFKPEEVNVKVQDNKLIVNARHEQKTAQTSVSREYSRQVDIPSGVNQDTLNCLLSKDGVLTIEGVVVQQSLETYLPVKSSPLSSSPRPSISSVGSPTSPTPRASITSISNPISSTPRPSITTMGTPVKNPIITDPDGTRRMRLTVDIGEFSPEEIVVKTTDRKLIVHAEHEERTAGRTLHKEFNKEYDLPETVDASNITAYLADDRQLTIEAPLKPAAQRKLYEVRESQDVQRVVVNKEGSVTIADSQNRPVITISVHRK